MAPALIQEVDDDSGPPKTIQLTEVEATLRRLLLDVASHIDSHPPAEADTTVRLPPELAKEPIILRFTGGWVRDKLLGVPSHDIDVAINKMTGYQFGLRLKSYLEIPGNLAKYGLEDIATNDKTSAKAGTSDKSRSVGGLHKIEANPEKSKHLETTTMRVLGLDIDLVNLRRETYSEDSRNPEMEFGTPEEDADRRDATVNALFYNINTETIEDFTGRGFDDMEAKIIRTPLEPYQTFKDDPLRVLRLIRFASRLGYSIDPKALDAMKDADIKDALRRKISRERVGVEIDKALRGPSPHEALRLVFELDLYATVFSDPTVEPKEHYAPDTTNWRALIDYLRDILEEERPLKEFLVREKEERSLAWQLAALTPYRDAPAPPPSAPGRRAPPPIAASIVREGVKATNKVCDVVAAAVKTDEEIRGLVDRFSERKRRPEKAVEGDDALARDVLGMAIRRWGTGWRSLVMWSFLVEVVEAPERGEATEKKYTTFLQHLQHLDILDAYAMKPLLDGKALAKALSTPPGPWMKDALDVVMAYQLRHPDTATTEQAIEEVRQARGELPSALVKHFLRLTIRPMFQRSRSQEITEAGRKREGEVLPEKLSMQATKEEEIKPWKKAKEGEAAMGLLGWCVRALDASVIEEVWHLVVPPVLTLVDDWEVRYKIQGAQLLTVVLEATPPALLQRTGLGEVFEAALMPCLAYLPTLAPEDEAVELLDAVFPALLALGRVRFPPETDASLPSSSKLSKPISLEEIKRRRTKFFDAVLRKGVFGGYEQCSNYPREVKTLFTHLPAVLGALGIEAVRHLKFLLPMLSQVLMHPSMSSQTKTLLAAVGALRAVVLNAWPRMHEHRGEVLKGLCGCWISIEAEGLTGDASVTLEKEEVKKELQETFGVLEVAIGETEVRSQRWGEELGVLIEADEKLGGLFGRT